MGKEIAQVNHSQRYTLPNTDRTTVLRHSKFMLVRSEIHNTSYKQPTYDD